MRERSPLSLFWVAWLASSAAAVGHQGDPRTGILDVDPAAGLTLAGAQAWCALHAAPDPHEPRHRRHGEVESRRQTLHTPTATLGEPVSPRDSKRAGRPADPSAY